MNFIDRRLNPQGKSLPNRQRFIERAKAEIRKGLNADISQRKLGDLATNARVKVSNRGTSEPFLHHGKGGERHGVVPGNKDYVRGDAIPRPRDGAGGGGSDGSADGGGEDSFEFTLTREEFLSLFFDELELPDLVKQRLGEAVSDKPRRAGYSTSGTPTALNVRRTMRNAMGRRIGLGRPSSDEVEACKAALDAAVASGDAGAISAAREALEAVLARVSRVPFLDPIDVRYNRFERVPKPTVQAVMFCLMDVSGSMTEHMKDLAKRFFMLLHLFLERKYEKVSVVFIRHTHEAQEVDEETFFRSRDTGGTVVSTALETMLQAVKDRFPPEDWNIYVAQASDGDNFASDNDRTLELLTEKILPMVQYYAYIEVSVAARRDFTSDLWNLYRSVAGSFPQFAMRRARTPAEIWGVLADLFHKDRSRAA